MNSKENKKEMRQEMRQIAYISNPVVLIVAVKALFDQSCLTLCGHMDYTQPTRLLCLRDSAASDTGVGCHVLLRGIFPTQGWNLHLLCLRH